MRKPNWQLVIAGVILPGFACLFFLVVLGMLPRWNDPAELMGRVGQFLGACGAISLALIVFGLIGRKAPTR
jgi:hypothetical protein